MRILLIYSLSPFWHEALCFAEKVCSETGGSYTLLAVASAPAEVATLETKLAEMVSAEADQLNRVRQGDYYQQILTEIQDEEYDLALIGGDPPASNPPQVATAEYLAEICPIPLGIVHACLTEWQRILICARTPDPSSRLVKTGSKLAQLLQADTHTLHVALPSQEEQQKTDTTAVQIRRGALQQVIQDEISSGNYGIVVVGAHKVPAMVPNLETTLAFPNITHQIIDLAPPVIIVVGQSLPLISEPAPAPSTRSRELKRMVRYVVVELVIYALLIVAYAAVAFHLLSDLLNDLFHENLTLYALMALLLILGQGIVLEELTSFLLDRLRLERFE